MKRSLNWLISIIMVSIILAGCTGGNEGNHNSNEESSMGTNISKEVTINIQDMLSDGFRVYYFNGFTGEDTLSFESVKNYNTIKMYQPAKIGQKFKFKNLGNLEAEIVDFSREEGYVKLHFESKDN